MRLVSASAGDGVVTINPDDTINYTPNNAYNGVDTITYTIADNAGNTALGQLSINVIGVNDAPVANSPVNQGTLEDNSVTFDVLSVATDEENDPLTVTAASAPNGSVAINPDNTLTYTPNANYNGPDTVTYTIDDGNGGTDTGTVSVSVTPVNDAPNPDTPAAGATNEDVTVNNIDVLGAATDPEGDTLTVTAASAPNGVVTINPDNTLNYTPKCEL